MEFHTIQSISVSSLNVYYVQTCNVIHQKPLQTLCFPPDLSVCSLPPHAARNQPSVGGFFYLFGNSRPDSQAVCSLTAPLAACPPIYPGRGDLLVAGKSLRWQD